MTGMPPNDNLNNAPKSATPEQEPQSLSLLGGVAKMDDLTEAERLEMEGGQGGSKLFGQGAILIALVVLTAGGVLYGMRVAQGELSGGADQQVEARVEAALARLTQPQTMRDDDPLAQQNLRALFDDTDTIVAMFATDRTASQVPVAYVQKNPFRTNLPEVQVVEKPADTGPSDAERRARRRAQLEREIQGMRLQSVMRGRTPIAIVNNEFLREGQTIGSFEVESISADKLTVVLVHEDERFTLSMQD
ncbi:hypothetical protein ACERK3_01230 [Phycisphaerales bacterium AB-hyl4]|uniref:Uncharacterized protein n=1 Tax=Natronomicrosphaera hydrolytica TaxID=3242702 RepID=A0ABV4U159_9BACT